MLGRTGPRRSASGPSGEDFDIRLAIRHRRLLLGRGNEGSSSKIGSATEETHQRHQHQSGFVVGNPAATRNIRRQTSSSMLKRAMVALWVPPIAGGRLWVPSVPLRVRQHHSQPAATRTAGPCVDTGGPRRKPHPFCGAKVEPKSGIPHKRLGTKWHETQLRVVGSCESSRILRASHDMQHRPAH